MSRKSLKKTKKSDLREELQDYNRKGYDLWLDGIPSTPKAIAKACCLAEEGSYMRDYIADERGNIRQIRFDFVKRT